MEIKENMMYASVEGSINSANAQQFGDAFSQAPDDTDGVVIDAKELEYISSAGLRVLLSLKKRCGDKTFKIVNVNSEVMNIFDVTGFSEIMDIIPASRSISIDGCEVIGRGACGECYRIDDETIIKLYYGDADIDWYLDFSPEIPKALKALAESLDTPILELPFLYEPIGTWKLN